MKTYRAREWFIPALALALALGAQASLGTVRPAAAAEAAFTGVAAQSDVPLARKWVTPEAGAYDFAYAGRGILTSKARPATFTLTIPGRPVAAFLYIGGSDVPDLPGRHFPAGDTQINVWVNNLGGLPKYTTVPVAYRGGSAFIHKLDITADVVQGDNRIRVARFNLNHPDGLMAVAVYETGGTEHNRIEIFEGADAGYYAARPPIGPDSEVVVSTYDAADQLRQGRMMLSLLDMQDGRGDEIFHYTGLGSPGDGLVDTDGDGLIDIVDRTVKLRRKDFLPLGNDWADLAKTRREAVEGAVSLEEDGLGRKIISGGYGRGGEQDYFEFNYWIPAGSSWSGIQVQSENPEHGDSFILALLVNSFPVPEGFNPVPNITVVKSPKESSGAPGLQVDFTFTVTSVGGGEALRDVSVADDPVLALSGPTGDTDGDNQLDLDETWVYTGSRVYPVVGEFPDTVTATGYGVESGDFVSDTDDARVVISVPLGSIGDFVWNDLDNDGAQDAGEPGLAGVGVTLTFGGVDPPAPLTTVTGAGGQYLFSSLPAGDYTVSVDPATLPAGMLPTWDYDGTATPHAASLALAAGATNLDVDFGYVVPRPDFTITKTASILLGGPGDPVTYEFTVTNTGNVPLVDVALVDDKLGDIGTVTLAVGASAKLYVTDRPLPDCGLGGATERTTCGGETTDGYRCSLTNTVTASWTTLTRTAWDCVDIVKPAIAVTKVADPTFGYLFTAVGTWPATTVVTPVDVTYTFAVTNPGGEPLRDVTVVDVVSGHPVCTDPVRTAKEGADELLDPGETWTYQQTCVYSEVGCFPDTVTATGWGYVSDRKVVDDASAYIEVAGCGICTGKVATLALRFDGAAAALVEVIPENDKFGDVKAFSGIVEPGGIFSFGPLSSTWPGFDGTLGTHVTVTATVDGVTTSVSIHTSCSQPIYPGQVWGSFTILEGTSKLGGSLCPYEETATGARAPAFLGTGRIGGPHCQD
jgi:hypothetical protein